MHARCATGVSQGTRGAHQEELRARTKLMRGLLLAKPTACRNSSVGETMTGGGRRAYMSPRNLASCVTACAMTLLPKVRKGKHVHTKQAELPDLGSAEVYWSVCCTARQRVIKNLCSSSQFGVCHTGCTPHLRAVCRRQTGVPTLALKLRIHADIAL